MNILCRSPTLLEAAQTTLAGIQLTRQKNLSVFNTTFDEPCDGFLHACWLRQWLAENGEKGVIIYDRAANSFSVAVPLNEEDELLTPPGLIALRCVKGRVIPTIGAYPTYDDDMNTHPLRINR